MQVHSSVGWDDIANQTLPAAMAEDCAADLNATRFETEQWSFTRVNVSAIPTTTSSADWPESSPVWVGPSADFVYIVGRGTLAAEAGAESPCATDKFVPGVGNGAFAIGIPGDAQGPNSGEFTRWAGHRFGFLLTDPGSGITLTGCSFELTPLGESLLGDAGAWASTSSDESCTTGAANEATDR